MKKITAWQVRIVALAFLVIFVGSSSQVLANTLAAGIEAETHVTTITTPIVQLTPHSSHRGLHIQHVRHAGADTTGGYSAGNDR